MIEVEGVGRAYGPIRALQDISFRIGEGEIVGLLGPNGAGKTTLLRILTGFFEPTEGSVRIDGVDVVANPKEAQAKIGYLPEHTPHYPEMLVQESLQMTAELRQVDPSRRRDLLSRAIWATGLEDQLCRPIGTLSKGFRQRVGIAQAILHEPRVVVLDEPTAGLDPNQVLEVRALIRRLSEAATVLFSTHVLPEVEQVCERAIVVMGGRLRADARLAELQASNGVLVAIEGGAEAHRLALRGLPGVQAVDRVEGRPGAFSVEGGGADLAHSIFRLAVASGWTLGELHPRRRTLESVFRELSQQKEITP